MLNIGIQVKQKSWGIEGDKCKEYSTGLSDKYIPSSPTFTAKGFILRPLSMAFTL